MKNFADVSSKKFFDMNVSDIKKDLEKKEAQFSKAINATTSDFARRGPGWVSQEVRKVYGADAAVIKEAYKGYDRKGRVKVGRVKINDVKLKYSGRPLTITHFKMTPKERPDKPYQVKATILKEKRMVHRHAFIAASNEATLAWIRVRKNGKLVNRLPVRPVKTVSVPQMISSERTEPAVQKRIGEELEKRWNHNIERYSKR